MATSELPPPASMNADETLPDTLVARWHALVGEVRRRLGPGARLEPRRAFEGVLGEDLSYVLVHRTPFAGRVATAAQAEAVTFGKRILGSAERLDERTVRGSALLAHEATHVLQHVGHLGDLGDLGQRAAPSMPAAGGAPSPAIQRAASAEDQAQAVEVAMLGAVGDADPAPSQRAARRIDPDVVAERVYRRLLDDLRCERERMAWPG